MLIVSIVIVDDCVVPVSACANWTVSTNWSQKQASKRTVTWKILFAINMGKTRYFKHPKYQNSWM